MIVEPVAVAAVVDAVAKVAAPRPVGFVFGALEALARVARASRHAFVIPPLHRELLALIGSLDASKAWRATVSRPCQEHFGSRRATAQQG